MQNMHPVWSGTPLARPHLSAVRRVVARGRGMTTRLFPASHAKVLSIATRRGLTTTLSRQSPMLANRSCARDLCKAP